MQRRAPGAAPGPAGGPVATWRVFLVGMMGCGKSTVGRRLAALLDVPYLDNDALLAARQGLDLMGLAGEGEARLHDAEAEIACELAAKPPPFVAGVAASVVEHPAEMALLGRAGFVVYLRAQPATLAQRVRSSTRPWLGGDALAWLSDTFARREPAFVAAAGLVLDTDGVDPAELARRIVLALGGQSWAGGS